MWGLQTYLILVFLRSNCRFGGCRFDITTEEQDEVHAARICERGGVSVRRTNGVLRRIDAVRAETPRGWEVHFGIAVAADRDRHDGESAGWKKAGDGRAVRRNTGTARRVLHGRGQGSR